MKLIVKNILLLLSFCLLTSCSNFKDIQKRTLGGSENLVIHSLKLKKNINTNKTVFIRDIQVSSGALSENSMVKKTKTFVLPLVVFNYWNHISEFNLGDNQIKNDLKGYLKIVFERGLSQAGYLIANTPEKADLVLDLNLKRCKAYAQYRKSGYFYFLLLAYGFNVNDWEGPYEGDVNIEVTTTDGKRKFISEVTGNAMLSINDFNSDIDGELGKSMRALEYSFNEAVKEFIEIAPK